MKNKLVNENEIYDELLRLNELKDTINAFLLVSVTDRTGKIVEVNKKFCDVYQYSENELIGQNHRILKSGHHSKEYFEKMWNSIQNGKVWHGDICNLRKDGKKIWNKMIIFPQVKNHKIHRFVSARVDITEQRNLLQELENANKELATNEAMLKKQMNDTLQKYSLEKQLMESNAELKSEKNFGKQKDEFSAMVAHELKTPIFPIKMHCKMLKEPEMLGELSPEQLESVNEIETMANKLSQLTNDILDAHKLDMNQMSFKKEEFNLKDFMQELAANCTPFVEKKEIQLDIQSENISIFSDKPRLSQILTNLIVNAVEFTPEKTGKINVGCESKNNEVIFHVKDNGIGIAPDKIKNLFRKFFQTDTSLKREHGGTGLGLVICKGIVEGLRGKIWVTSKQNHGTVFYFTIPKIKIYDYVTGVRNPELVQD